MKHDNTNDTERLRYQDVNLRRAIQRRQQRAPQLPADFCLHHRKRVTRWHRIAAALIGFIIVSGLALAAWHAFSPTKEQQPTAADAQWPTVNPQLPTPVHFSNARLDSILAVVANHGHRAVSFRSDEPRSLRFTITWNPDQPLADFLATVNEFEGLRLTDARDTIFVEQTTKESHP